MAAEAGGGRGGAAGPAPRGAPEGFLVGLGPAERRAIFSTPQRALRRAAAAHGGTRSGEFVEYVLDLLAGASGTARSNDRRSLNWLLPPARMMALLGPERKLVNLLQFAWGGAAVELSESLVGEDRLFAEFLRESLALLGEGGGADEAPQADAPTPWELLAAVERLAAREQAMEEALAKAGSPARGPAAAMDPVERLHRDWDNLSFKTRSFEKLEYERLGLLWPGLWQEWVALMGTCGRLEVVPASDERDAATAVQNAHLFRTMPGVDDPDALASQLQEGLGHPDAFALFMDAVKAQSERPAFWENYFGRAIGSGSILPLLCMIADRLVFEWIRPHRDLSLAEAAVAPDAEAPSWPPGAPSGQAEEVLKLGLRQIAAHKFRLTAACEHAVRDGAQRLLRTVVGLCWRQALVAEAVARLPAGPPPGDWNWEDFADRARWAGQLPRPAPPPPGAAAADPVAQATLHAEALLRLAEAARRRGDSAALEPLLEWFAPKASHMQARIDELVQELDVSASREQLLQGIEEDARDKIENIEDKLERLNAEVSLLSHELEKRRGEPSALGGMDAPDLKLLESELEDTLKRVRAAQLSVVTQQRQACSICMVNNGNEVAFQCGHQTCKPCSTQIDHCAVCRCKITSRIDLFGG